MRPGLIWHVFLRVLALEEKQGFEIFDLSQSRDVFFVTFLGMFALGNMALLSVEEAPILRGQTREGMRMLSIVNYGGYVAAAAALCLTPGIDTVYILMRTIAGGRAEGLASALGINTGLVVHTVLVAAGLSLVLAASPVAFNLVKFAGAAYLVIMGVRSVVSKGSSFAQLAEERADAGDADEADKNAVTAARRCAGNMHAGEALAPSRSEVACVDAATTEAGVSGDKGAAAAPRHAGVRRIYAQGVLTNVLNPKIILFFLALLPQFIATPNEHGPLPFLVLGLTYVALSTLWTVVIVLIAAPFSRLLMRSPRAGRVTGVVSGVVYVLLGAMIFFTA